MSGRHSRWLAGVACAASVGAGWVAHRAFRAEFAEEIVFLSVGQGDCALVRSGGLTALIDVGPRNEGFDAGARLVAPKLRQRGVQRIDVLLLSHPDVDHIGGLAGVAKRIPIGRILVPAHFRGHPQLEETLREAAIPDESVVWVRNREVVELGRVRLTLGVPAWDPLTSDNEGSLFVRLEQNGQGAATFSGDAGFDTEIAMVREGDWKAAVLKAGHHGSAASTGHAWLRAVAPAIVVFSCGRDNPFGHPSAEAAMRTMQVGATIRRTDREGDLRFSIAELIGRRRAASSRT